MDEFTREIRLRVDEASASLEVARAEGDEFLADVHTGELESLGHLAREHGVEVSMPEAIGPAGRPVEIDLTPAAEAAEAC
jgi:pyruvate/2-oxoglutarate dehydrogenase complex dihydrolipoamide acyltransferase (E2) component